MRDEGDNLERERDWFRAQMGREKESHRLGEEEKERKR